MASSRRKPVMLPMSVMASSRGSFKEAILGKALHPHGVQDCSPAIKSESQKSNEQGLGRGKLQWERRYCSTLIHMDALLGGEGGLLGLHALAGIFGYSRDSM